MAFLLLVRPDGRSVLSADTTASWLAYLATSVGTLLAAAFVLGNKRRLRSDGRMYALAPMVLGVLSLASSYGSLVFDGIFSVSSFP